MLRRLIVGISGSKFSRSAVQAAITYAKQHEAEVVGISVIDIPRLTAGEPVPLGGGAYKLQSDAARVEQAEKDASGWLAEFSAECETHQVTGSAAQCKGEPAEILAHEAQRGDLLILGRKRMAEGGEESSKVIERLLRLTGRPILTVPAAGVPDGRPVLVAYDGSPQAAAALQAFQLLGLAGGRPIHILFVTRDEADTSAADMAADYLRLHGHEVYTHREASRRAVAEVITQEASRLKAGVIVMGACGRPRVAEAIFGSVTRAVLSQSDTALFLHH